MRAPPTVRCPPRKARESSHALRVDLGSPRRDHDRIRGCLEYVLCELRGLTGRPSWRWPSGASRCSGSCSSADDARTPRRHTTSNSSPALAITACTANAGLALPTPCTAASHMTSGRTLVTSSPSSPAMQAIASRDTQCSAGRQPRRCPRGAREAATSCRSCRHSNAWFSLILTLRASSSDTAPKRCPKRRDGQLVVHDFGHPAGRQARRRRR